MNLDGDIIVIEDDADDREILEEVLEDVLATHGFKNKIVLLDESTKVIDYLKDMNNSPFLIVSDINMPKLDGFQLRNLIFNDKDLNEKCIPYIFITTSGDNEEFMRKAYGMSIQGYFTKPSDYKEYKTLMTDIIKYWKVAKIANRAGYYN